MPTPSRQTVANELNKLQSSGATEQQIDDYIAKSGYTNNDFNVSLNGSFEPLTTSPQSKVAGVDYAKPTNAELAESNQYYQNLATSSSVPSGNAPTITGTGGVTGTTRVTTVTQTTNEVWQQSTGGGSTTTYSTPAKDTSASLVYKQEAQTASDLQQAYALNPDSRFGKSALDRRLADGRITQEQYNDIVNSTPEERKAKSSEYYNQYQEARSKETAAQEGGNPQVVVKPEPNTSTYTVQSNTTITSEVTKVKGDVPGAPNVTTETVDGTEYQVVSNNDGTYSYTPVDSEYGEEESIDYNPDDGDILREPPGTEIDEFGNLDAQIAANENALQEPPFLSEEEANDYLQNFQDENIESDNTTIEDGSDPGTYFENNGEASVSQTFYENDGTPSFAAAQGQTSSLFNTQSQATQQDANNALAKGDWRVRLSLAPGANYLYKGQNAGILAPLQETGGVLFPYTPSITVNYAASYDATELTHSNYKVFQYKSSAVDSISIGCDFTAQDTKEARYILAVIHFFRSVTKMFYGQDQNPQNGTPPPLCYLTGMGAFQFDRHPLAITSFNMSLPTDVDYIRAGAVNDNPGVSTSSEFFRNNIFNQSLNNLSQSLTKIGFGGVSPAPAFKTRPSGSTEATYVPTKINISISAVPINSRNDISNNFSLRDYATGQLLRGSKNRTGTGMW